MSIPTEKEIILLQKFRQNVNDVDINQNQLSDMFLLSWIRARENDLGKAEDMLRKSIKWRIANEMDKIFDWEAPESYATCYPYQVTGLDNDGRPVAVIPLGRWDVRTLIEKGERIMYIRYVDQFFMRVLKYMKEHCSKSGHTQFVIVVDLKGFGLRQVTCARAVETVLETMRRFEANFPEILKTAYIVNAPRIFPMAYAIVKPLLSTRTQDKIKIFNSNESKWKLALLNAIPAKTLPTIYGGTDTTYDHLLSYGEIPNQASELLGGEGLIKVTVGAGDKLRLEYDIVSPGSCISWEFRTEDFDIGFSVSNETNAVFAYKRCDSHLQKETGLVICSSAGKYTLEFDNKYSRMRGKTLHYNVVVTGSTED